MGKVIAIILVLLVIIAGILISLQQCKHDISQPEMQTKYFVETTSRIYYFDDYTQNDIGLTLHRYWWLDNKKWVYDKGDLRLTEKGYGPLAVKDRQ